MNENESVEIKLSPDKLLVASAPPHIRHGETTADIMQRVLIALTPAFAWAVFIFGYRAAALTLVSVISCVMFEFLCQKLMRRPVSIGDLSAAVTGVLIAFGLPVGAPLWAPVVGGAFAVILVKQLFGGIGKNIVNPAVAAHVFLFLSFGFMGAHHDAGAHSLPALEIAPEIIAGPVPLVYLNEGIPPPSVGMLDLLLGYHGGLLGEVSTLLLLAGGIYLMAKKVITWHIPVSFVGAVALVAFLAPRGADHIEFTVSHVMAGGLMLGALFMATDYATSPVSGAGKLIFGAGCGLVTIFLRYFGAHLDGVWFAIMLMNMLVWCIDRLTKPKKFGGGAKAGKKPGIYAPARRVLAIGAGCGVLCAALVSAGQEHGLAFAAAGFALGALAFAGARMRADFADPPKILKGVPLEIAAAGLVVMAFAGLMGIAL